MASIVTSLIEVTHAVYKWGQHKGGFTFSQSPSGFYGKTEFAGPAPINVNTILIPMDPLTAIGLGLVTPEELGYPAGLLAASNIMKGN